MRQRSNSLRIVEPTTTVLAALDMKKALAEFNSIRQAEGQEPIHIGIGINTGTVVTGAIGSSKSLQYTAIGDAMNTGARLCSTAKANEIIISEWTMAKVVGRVEVQPLAPVEVKNKRDKLQIFNVLGLSQPGVDVTGH
jgi:adenylate cyclase